MRSELTEFLLLDFFSGFLDCFFFFTNGYHIMPLSVEYINSIKFTLIACSDLFHAFASFRGVSISYLLSDLNYFENKKVNFVFSISYLCKFLLYGGMRSQPCRAFSRSSRHFKSKFFNISYAYFVPYDNPCNKYYEMQKRYPS
jgi:hypothetical protein